MLERIREGSQGIIAKSILGLVILTFALAGVGSYLNTTTEQPVAVVNGEEISRASYEQALQNQRARMENQFGEMFAMLAADDAYMAGFRNDVLESLIDETLQKQFARSLGLRVGDDQIRDAIREMPEFQIEGHFNNERYLALISQAGYTATDFRDLLRDQLSRTQLIIGLFSSEFATAAELQQLAKLQQQTRDIQYAQINAEDFKAQVQVTDTLLQNYYNTHIQQFELPQKVAVEYVELSAATLAEQVDVTEQQVAEYYNTHKAEYTQAEKRQVAHIMLDSVDVDDTVAAKAEALLAQLKDGADFAELAKTESTDTFSAENGGVLEGLKAGDMDAEFEKVAFSLATEGELSPVVKSAYGYHIIKLVSFEPESVKPLSDVRDDVAAKIKQEQGLEQFYELLPKVTEVAFEVPDSLDEAAAILDVKVKTTPLFSRDEVAAPLNHPQVLNKIYDAAFIAEAANSDVIEVAAQHVVVVRVKENQNARTQSLDEVKATVETAVLAEESSKLAQQRANTLLADAGSKAFAALIADAGLTLEESEQTPRFGGLLNTEIRTKAFALPRPTDSNISNGVVTLANGDVALVAVTAVHDAEVTAVPDAAQLDRLADQQAERLFSNVIAALKADAKITRNLRAEQSNTEEY